MLMFSQKELIKEWLHPINNVNLHFVFHRFSLYRTKMALAHTNYGNYGAIRQNCFKHNFLKFIQMNSPSCSIHFTKLWNQEVSFCTDFFFLVSHMDLCSATWMSFPLTTESWYYFASQRPVASSQKPSLLSNFSGGALNRGEDGVP